MDEKIVRLYQIRGVAEAGGNKLLGYIGAWVGENLVHAAVFDDTAAFHHGNTISDGAHDIHFVSNHHDGDAELFVYSSQQFQHVVRGFRIKGRGGFICKEETGVCG